MNDNNSKEPIELALNRMNGISERYDSINSNVKDIYEAISENWQGNGASILVESFEEARNESESSRKLMRDITVSLQKCLNGGGNGSDGDI